MNNENNNEINSQPMNNQPINNQQSMSNQPINNQQVNPAVQGFQQPVQQPMNNMNPQPMNNNPATQQFAQNSQVNNNIMQNSGQAVNPATQQFQQPVQQPMNNQPINNQQVNPAVQGFQQPMNNQPINNQNYNDNFTQTTNKKNNKMLFIIIGVVVLIVIAIVVLILVLSGNNSKGNTINDFEKNDVGDVNNEVEVAENDTIAYQGFTFKKQSGYQYEIDANGLEIGNNSFATMVSVASGNLATLKSSQADLIKEYSNLGCNPTNAKIEKYGNKEVMTIELTVKGQKALFYLMDADNSHSFLGIAVNPYYTINYDDINTTISLLSSAKFTGDYKAPTDKLKAIEYKNLFE